MLTSHAHHQSQGDSPNANEVLRYLHELLQQSAFSASERNRRFLTYVVEETLEGRADRIKAYNIALAAFDRTADFDPLTDPIVRIEASRLRRSLEHYYLTAGSADRIRIAIPKGSYAATFDYQGDAPTRLADAVATVSAMPPVRRARSVRWLAATWAKSAAIAVCCLMAASVAVYLFMKSAEQPAHGAAMAGLPSLLILPLEDTGGDPSRSFVARGLTYEIGTALTNLQNLTVYAAEPSFGSTSPIAAAASDFTLMGSVQSDRDSIRVAVFLMDSRTGRFLQSWTFQRHLAGNGLVGTQMSIAQDIRASLERDCMAIARAKASGSAEAMLDCRRLVAFSKS